MALSQAAYVVEKLIGHRDNAITEQDITNPGQDRAKYADPSGEMMKALVWEGKNTVKMGECRDVYIFTIGGFRPWR
jgi:hypothetical protein